MVKLVLSFLTILILSAATGCNVSFEELEDITYPYPDSKEVIMTLEEYKLLETGMSIDEVWEIIGGKCTSTALTDLGMGEEYITESYGCNGNGQVGANVILMFQGNKLITKGQTGLK